MLSLLHSPDSDSVLLLMKQGSKYVILRRVRIAPEQTYVQMYVVLSVSSSPYFCVSLH